MASVLGQFTPTPRVPQAYTSGPVTALRVQNGSSYTLRVVLGGQLFDKIPAGADQTYNVANLGGFGGWVLLIPGGSPTPNTSLNAPGGYLAGPVTVTSYGSNDVIPYGSATQQSEAQYRPFLAQPDEILDSLHGALAFNARVFGCAGDGVTDDSVAIQACINALAVCGGGELYFPAGTYICANITLASYVNLRGAGKAITVLMLKSGANTDLLGAFQGNINLSGTGGTGPTWNGQAILSFYIQDMTLDGNYANQASGPSYPLRYYGLGWVLQNLEVRNGYSGNILIDYYGPFPSTLNGPASRSNPWLDSSKMLNVNAHHARGTTTAIGIEVGGPTDSQFTDVVCYNNNGTSFHVGPNSGGIQAKGCHMWQSGLADPNSCTWLQEASLYAVGCEAEGSPYVQFAALNTEIIWVGGSIFAGNAAGLGLQIGQQAGLTPFTNSVRQSAGLTTAFAPFVYAFRNVLFMNITHASGHIWFANDGGDAIVDGIVLASVSTQTIYSGAPSTATQLNLVAHGFTDARKQIMGTSGQTNFGQGAAQDPGTAGTISTAGATVAIVQPAANETAVIMQAGTVRGQILFVINISTTNSITFAGSSTSHVADGTSDIIQPLTTALYVWELGLNFWYRVK